jgi:hypothetical protein
MCCHVLAGSRERLSWRLKGRSKVAQTLFLALPLIFHECAQEFVESKPGSSEQCKCT